MFYVTIAPPSAGNLSTENPHMRRIVGICLAVLLFIPNVAPGQGRSEEARKHLVRGATAIEMAKTPEDLSLAASEFRKATEIEPGMPAAWYNLGMVLGKSGKLKEAIASYQRYLLLAPRASDAPKIRDEVIKLEFRLEQEEKFKALSGQWVSQGGNLAFVTADAGRLAVYMTRFSILNEYSLTLDGTTNDITPAYLDKLFDLRQKDGQYIGAFESGSFRPGLKCVAPAQKTEVTGSVEGDRIVLRMPWTRFRAVERFGSLFDTEVYCTEVSSMGTMTVEFVLHKLPSAGIPRNAPGLQQYDSIAAVDGVALATLSQYDRAFKLRGKAGAKVQLTITRLVERAGTFTPAKFETVQANATLTEVPNDPPAYKKWQEFFN